MVFCLFVFVFSTVWRFSCCVLVTDFQFNSILVKEHLFYAPDYGHLMYVSWTLEINLYSAVVGYSVL